jgi:hypothetical protein
MNGDNDDITTTAIVGFDTVTSVEQGVGVLSGSAIEYLSPTDDPISDRTLGGIAACQPNHQVVP